MSDSVHIEPPKDSQASGVPVYSDDDCRRLLDLITTPCLAGDMYVLLDPSQLDFAPLGGEVNGGQG